MYSLEVIDLTKNTFRVKGLLLPYLKRLRRRKPAKTIQIYKLDNTARLIYNL